MANISEMNREISNLLEQIEPWACDAYRIAAVVLSPLLLTPILWGIREWQKLEERDGY